MEERIAHEDVFKFFFLFQKSYGNKLPLSSNPTKSWDDLTNKKTKQPKLNSSRLVSYP